MRELATIFFSAETQQGIFDAVLKGYIDFDSDPWPLISKCAKDLISKMLCSRPSERLTAHEVLCMSNCSKLFLPIKYLSFDGRLHLDSVSLVIYLL